MSPRATPRDARPTRAGVVPAKARRREPVVDVSARRGMARHAPLLRRIARGALVRLGESASELSVALVDDDAIRELNRDYRGKDRATDVLAFSLREGEPGPVGDAAPLGDVVISLPTAQRQARQRGHGVERELTELLVHGILHLLGYDHERSPADARKMFATAREVVAAVVPVETRSTPRVEQPAKVRGRRSARRRPRDLDR